MQPLPQRAVALVGHGEDVRRDLAQVVLAVALHGGSVVQARQQLVGVHRRQDGADVRLGRGETQHHVTPSHKDTKSKATRDHVSSNTQLRPGGDTAGGARGEVNEEEENWRQSGGVGELEQQEGR